MQGSRRVFPKTGAGAGHSREQKMNPTQALCHVQKKKKPPKCKIQNYEIPKR